MVNVGKIYEFTITKKHRNPPNIYAHNTDITKSTTPSIQIDTIQCKNNIIPKDNIPTVAHKDRHIIGDITNIFKKDRDGNYKEYYKEYDKEYYKKCPLEYDIKYKECDKEYDRYFSINIPCGYL